ncbi:hypothetical protein RND81_14G169100 [Saponaria officinalis]|uniref:F-box domain-containing protein n=1 Tax=Saponaria officinalis TaxID=3572 RepID=A0AAW1GP25_SAPOF
MVYQPNSFGPLCEDLLVNIICRLPERDVLGCKCVSKEWHRIVFHVCVPWLSDQAPISGVYFRVAQGHEVPFVTTFSPQDAKDQVNHLVAYNHSVHYIGTASLKPNFESIWRHSCVKVACSSDMSLASLLPFDHRGPDFLDCCNCLVLFVQRPRPHFFVCNPAIRQCVPVPLPPRSVHLSSLYAFLAFDHSESIEYRVCFHVFYSQTREWKTHEVKIEPVTSSKCFKLVRHSVYLKNIVYRLSMFYKILCFDLESVKARVLNCPSQKSSLNLSRDVKDEPPPGCIGMSNGFLSYVTDEDEHVCVWLLDKPNESSQWTLKYRIRFSHLWNDVKKQCFYGRIVWLRPCGFHPTSDILFLGNAGTLFMYHIGSGRLETVRYLLFSELHCGFYFPLFLHKKHVGHFEELVQRCHHQN